MMDGEDANETERESADEFGHALFGESLIHGEQLLRATGNVRACDGRGRNDCWKFDT
jgi:hypothetical protein